ncbi:MAG TPA: glycosyltransferase family 2 protein [Chitinophagaceae bacterium]|jgi:glycosyltransferase involved in cell wall biosynthesis|nr:glycosyltransferase family 2 protein [Chitinophagaceae bacterium]
MLPSPNDNIFIVLPAYNEKKEVLEQTVTSLLRNSYNIVVVDDGSCQKISLPGHTHLFLLRHRVNLGQGAALQTGIKYAIQKGACFIVTFDSDGQHDPGDLPAMLAPLQNEPVDITLGSRFIKKGSHNATTGRRLVLKAGRLVNYFFTGLYLSDSHNGFRAMTRMTAEKMIITENGMAHATEMLLVIKKNKLKFREIPVTILYTDYSRKKGQSVFNSIRIFFDLLLHKLFQ